LASSNFFSTGTGYQHQLLQDKINTPEDFLSFLPALIEAKRSALPPEVSVRSAFSKVNEYSIQEEAEEEVQKEEEEVQEAVEVQEEEEVYYLREHLKT
jgi:hypothetical protein